MSGRRLTDQRQRCQPVHARHRQVEEDEIGLLRPGELDRLLTVARLADDLEAVLLEQGGEGLPGQGMVVDDEDALCHRCLIGSDGAADEREVNPPARPDSYRSWLIGELVLVLVLSLGTFTLLLTGRLGGYPHPESRLALGTAVAVVAAIVAVLTGIRFLVEGRLMDALLCGAFVTSAVGAVLFDVAPSLDGGRPSPWEEWAWVASGLVATGLLAVAPFIGRRVSTRRPILLAVVVGSLALLAVMWFLARSLDVGGVAENGVGAATTGLATAYAVQASLAVVAAVGFGLRYRRSR